MKKVIEQAVWLSSADLMGIGFGLFLSMNSAQNPFEGLPTMDELQQRHISYMLEKTNGRVSGNGAAAEILGINRTTLAARMEKSGWSSR